MAHIKPAAPAPMTRTSTFTRSPLSCPSDCTRVHYPTDAWLTLVTCPLRTLAMPSFDVISEVDKHELTNAVDQANRELTTRFDFKGQNASSPLHEFFTTQSAPSEFQLQQMLDILRARLIARKIDTRALDVGDPETNLGGSRQKITVK